MEMKKNLLRYPRLDTVLMVEDFVQRHDGDYRKKELWSKLPRKMMYQTFQVTIDYLIQSNKISIDSEGKIGWIYYPRSAELRKTNEKLHWKGTHEKTVRHSLRRRKREKGV